MTDVKVALAVWVVVGGLCWNAAAADENQVGKSAAKEVEIYAGTTRLRIPAPDGFESLDEEDLLAKMLKAQADGDKVNKTLGMWARTESGEWDDIQQACVKVVKSVEGRKVSLADFESARKAICKEIQDAQKQLPAHVNESYEAVSREMSRLAETDVNASIGGIRFLKPHVDKQDRIEYTMVGKELCDIGGEKSVSLAVISGATVWIRGIVFALYVSHTVAEDEAAVESAVAATREKLDQWLAQVEVANPRSSLDVEDAIARTDPHYLRPYKRRDSGSSSAWVKIVTWTIIGGVSGLLSSLFRRKGEKADPDSKVAGGGQ